MILLNGIMIWRMLCVQLAAYGSKIYCAFVFVPHKGPKCMPNTFIHISFGFHLKNKVGFCIMYCNPRK